MSVETCLTGETLATVRRDWLVTSSLVGVLSWPFLYYSALVAIAETFGKYSICPQNRLPLKGCRSCCTIFLGEFDNSGWDVAAVSDHLAPLRLQRRDAVPSVQAR